MTSRTQPQIQTRLAALLAGILFGAGLVVSGMTDPDKIIAFLTLNQHWNPALIVVMGSALLTTAAGYAVANRRAVPLFAEQFHLPAATTIDRRLLTGSALFGVGWALSGYCPGPAIVGTFLLDARAVVFVLAYLAGNALFEFTRLRTSVALVDG